MLTGTEYKTVWEKILKIACNDISKGDTTPEETAKKIIKRVEKKKSKEVFATLAQIMRHDGRIYGKNREWSDTYPINYQLLSDEERWNVRCHLDDIHPAHINQIMTYIREA